MRSDTAWKGTVFAVPYFLTPLFSSPHFFCCTYSTIFGMISITLTLVNTEGKNIYVEYDAKLDEIEIW